CAVGHCRLLVGGLVGVDHALAFGLVELARRGPQRGLRRLAVTGVGGLAEVPARGLQRRLDALVAQPRGLVGADPLDLGLDVYHEEASTFGWVASSTCDVRPVASASQARRDNRAILPAARR